MKKNVYITIKESSEELGQYKIVKIRSVTTLCSKCNVYTGTDYFIKYHTK